MGDLFKSFVLHFSSVINTSNIVISHKYQSKHMDSTPNRERDPNSYKSMYHKFNYYLLMIKLSFPLANSIDYKYNFSIHRCVRERHVIESNYLFILHTSYILYISLWVYQKIQNILLATWTKITLNYTQNQKAHHYRNRHSNIYSIFGGFSDEFVIVDSSQLGTYQFCQKSESDTKTAITLTLREDLSTCYWQFAKKRLAMG